MINNIFPCGGLQNSYNITYSCQNDDFDVHPDYNTDKPSLLNMKKFKDNIFNQLLRSLFACGFAKEGIMFYKTYFSKYNIEVRTLILELFNSVNNFDDFSTNDLRYLLNLVKSEYAITENNSNWKIHFFKTLKKYCECGGKIETSMSEENIDQIMKEIHQISDTWRSPLYKYALLHIENEELRYYLSILDREYYAIWYMEKNTKGIYLEFINYIVAILDKKIEEQEKNYLKEILDYSENDLKPLFIKFLKSCEKCKSLPEFHDYDFNNIDYEKLFNKVKSNTDVIKRIVAAQNRLDKLVELNLTDGDFTYLVVSQIKVIELYLKLVISANMKGEKIYSDYNFMTGQACNPKKCLIINENNAQKLISGKFKIQLATASYIININKQLCFENYHLNKEDDLFFNPIPEKTNFNSRLFKFWIDKTRNGYFHTHPILTINDALEINYKTAFCFYRVIDLLKGIE